MAKRQKKIVEQPRHNVEKQQTPLINSKRIFLLALIGATIGLSLSVLNKLDLLIGFHENRTF